MFSGNVLATWFNSWFDKTVMQVFCLWIEFCLYENSYFVFCI